MDDWKTQIAAAVILLARMVQVDTKQLLQYHLPNLAATEQQLAAAEEHLGFPLDPQYRKFLSHADGWRGFYQDVDLFGTEELRGGSRMQEALDVLDEVDFDSLPTEFAKSDLLPIGYSRTQREVLLLLRPDSAAAGMVLWSGVYEIARYPNFDEFFQALVDYNRRDLDQLQQENGSTGPREVVDGDFWLSARQAAILGASTIEDWEQEIAAAVKTQEELKKVDTDQLWEYPPPNAAATEDELAGAEEHLGFPLDPQYRNFLSYANGWRCIIDDVDLFGTDELMGGPRMQQALELIEIIEEFSVESPAEENITTSDLLPIGHSKTQRDEFFLLKPDSVAPGMVLWYYLPEIERYPNFDAFFLAMVDYNRLRLEGFQEENNREPPVQRG